MKLFTKFFIILSVVFFVLLSGAVKAEEKINLYFFYGNGCSHCAKEEIFLDKLKKQRKDIVIYRYETWNSTENAKLLAKIGKELGVRTPGVPMLFIGNKVVTGYFNDEITGKQILDILDEYSGGECVDIVASIIGTNNGLGECIHGCTGDSECIHNCGCFADTPMVDNKMPEFVSVPFFGEVNIKNVSLPVFTFLLAAADGFNPCAMWVLLFLISLLIRMENKRRMWLLGVAFIVVSGAVYFLFLSAWLNLFLFLGFVMWVRILVGLVALTSGVWHLKDAWQNRDGGCHVIKSDRRKYVFSRLRDLVKEQKIWIALLGIVFLAFAVNLVELVCSAGLPAVYTNVLSLSGLPVWQYYAYLLFYILIFMLDDLLVFFLAMSTLRMKAFSSKYTQWSGWVGGIIMFIIGLLLIFKPGWLMFG